MKVTTLALVILAGCPVTVDPIVPAGMVEVSVLRLDADGCLHHEVVAWPETYWGEQATGSCNMDDRDWYFARDGGCWAVSGSCEGWQADPAVELCADPNEPCCMDDASCPNSE